LVIICGRVQSADRSDSLTVAHRLCQLNSLSLVILCLKDGSDSFGGCNAKSVCNGNVNFSHYLFGRVQFTDGNDSLEVAKGTPVNSLSAKSVKSNWLQWRFCQFSVCKGSLVIFRLEEFSFQMGITVLVVTMDILSIF
jgi:hypothetical protein